MRILLTGATGFLGSHLIPAFLKAGHEVIILKRSFSDVWRIKEYINDISSYDIDCIKLEQPFRDHGNINAVIHTATSYGRKGEKATEVFETNLVFPLRLLETATSFKIATFFNTDTFLNVKTILYKYLNSYALSKKQFAEWGHQFALMDKINFVNIKVEHMYGPLDDPSKFATWIVRECLKNTPKLDLTPGEQKRDFIYIDDVVNAYLKLLNNCRSIEDKFQQYDLGSGEAVSIKNFVEKVHSLTNSKTRLLFGAIPYRENEIMKSRADITKLLKLGWKPKYDLVTGLKKMIEVEMRKIT